MSEEAFSVPSNAVCVCLYESESDFVPTKLIVIFCKLKLLLIPLGSPCPRILFRLSLFVPASSLFNAAEFFIVMEPSDNPARPPTES